MVGTTWKLAVADELARLYEPGDSFTLVDFYTRAEARLQEMYPGNTTVRATIRQVLQRHRDSGLVTFHGNGKYTYNGVAVPVSPRHVTPLAQAAYDLAATVTAETKIAASDYLAIARSADPEGALADMITAHRASPTFVLLHQQGRLDLSFERLAITDAAALGISPAVVSSAAHRLTYYESGEEF